MSDTKRIRVLTVAMVEREVVYVVNKPRPLTINGEREMRTITNIELVGDVYQMYISVDEESRHWKDEPKNNRTTVEYFID
jgi:hypothetical protein